MIGNVLITYIGYFFYNEFIETFELCALVVTVGHGEIGNNFARLQNDVPL